MLLKNYEDIENYNMISRNLEEYYYNTAVPLFTDLFVASSYIGLGRDYKMIPLDYEMLKRNKRYRNILNTNINSRKRENILKTGIRERMEKLATLLEFEIDK